MPSKKKGGKRKGKIDYIRYNPIRHSLDVGLCDQNLTYIGVPESMHLKLRCSDDPETIFMNEVFNRYPVVIGPMPLHLKPITPSKLRQIQKRKSNKA